MLGELLRRLQQGVELCKDAFDVFKPSWCWDVAPVTESVEQGGDAQQLLMGGEEISSGARAIFRKNESTLIEPRDASLVALDNGGHLRAIRGHPTRQASLVNVDRWRRGNDFHGRTFFFSLSHSTPAATLAGPSMPATFSRHEVSPGVCVLRFSNPAKRNALDVGLLDALDATLSDDDGVRVWLLCAEGPVFSSGYDLHALTGFPGSTPLPDERLGVVLDNLMHHRAPSVALVDGAAIGAGCELACACDFRIGGMAARFAMPPAQLGLVYALKGLKRIVARTSPQVARRLFLTGQPMDATQAQAVGLLDELSQHPEKTALEWCGQLAKAAPLAVSGLKRGFSLLGTLDASLEELEAYERLRRHSFNSDDAREGRAALLERRMPNFRGC